MRASTQEPERVSPPVVALIVFFCILAGTLLGRSLRAALPDHHLGPDSKDVVMLGIGMIATMTALILGLMTASAKSSFDQVDAAVKHAATGALALDRTLAAYGKQTKPVRDLVRNAIEFRLDASWPEERSQAPEMTTPATMPSPELIQRQIVDLSPKTEAQRWFKSQALVLMSDVLLTRWAVFGATGSSISTMFLVVVVFWLALIFGSFGLFAPRNPTVVTVLVVCALSVAASVFLILEMDDPFNGIMKVSSAPLRYTLANLGQ